MQARGKTCFLQQQQNIVKQKSEKVPQKKATEKVDVLKNQLKKCNLEVRRAFCTQVLLKQKSLKKIIEVVSLRKHQSLEQLSK